MTTRFATGISTEKDSKKAGEQAARAAFAKLGKAPPHFGITFCSNEYDYKEVLEGIRSVCGSTPLIGCSSGGEFTEDRVETGSICCAFISSDSHQFQCGIAQGIKKDPEQAMIDATHNFPKEIKGFPNQSALILIDGLAGKGEEMPLATRFALNPEVQLIGGAAADGLKFQETSVFYDGKTYLDASSFCLLNSKTPIAIGVKHGHCPISPAYTITKAKDNIVYELDGKPALSIWKQEARECAQKHGIDVSKLKTPEDLSAFFLLFEAGLLTGTDYKVRFPFSANEDNNSLNFGCTMIEGSKIRVMESPSSKAQIESAGMAAQNALEAMGNKKVAGAIVFDCMCRKQILKEEFFKSVESIKKALGPIPLIGFETYGEIAMEPHQLSGFHNTTTVVMLIPD